MARKRKAPQGGIPGHPSTWKGKEFRATGLSKAVVLVTAYERGAGGKWSVYFECTQNPKVPDAVGDKGRLYPDEFQQRFAPYDPNEPVVEPFDITKALTGKRPEARVIPIRPRKDQH